MVFAYQIADENDAIKSPSLMRAYLGGTPAQQPARYDEASALHYIDRDSPPTLILHGQLDTLTSPCRGRHTYLITTPTGPAASWRTMPS